MANPSYVESLLGPLPVAERRVFSDVFRYVLNNLRWGPVAHQVRAENFQSYALTATTPGTADQEFSIAHGLGRVPTTVMPVLALDQVGSVMPILKVTRAADANRVYLSSPSTSVTFSVWAE